MYKFSNVLLPLIIPAFSGLKPKPLRNWYGKTWAITEEEIFLKKQYRQHCADFLRNCPEDRRLILESINCDWKVICDFVGKPIPEIDWPHKNKNATILDELMAPDQLIPQVLKKEMHQFMKKNGFL